MSEAVVEDSRVKQHNDDGINVIQHRDKRVRNNRETSNVTMKRTTVTEANSNGNGQGGTGKCNILGNRWLSWETSMSVKNKKKLSMHTSVTYLFLITII